ncbi:inositol phosphatase-domain-containing protein [Dichotomocladium elegans]|nr:inositol phosphatase-domain-containing protein [Dichotomocladium elegans]
MSAEPGNERRGARIRMDAIAVSREIVIPDDETSIAGWTLLSPTEPQKTAIYVCSFNYKLEKVVQFKRIELDTVSSIQTGEYILSSTTPLSRDPNQNYGFLLFYNADRESIRLNSGSIDNQGLNDFFLSPDLPSSGPTTAGTHEAAEADRPQQAFLAFKAVRYNILGEVPEYDEKTCREQVQDITDMIAEACGRIEDDHFVVYHPIIRCVSGWDIYRALDSLGRKYIVSKRPRTQTVSSQRWDLKSSRRFGCKIIITTLLLSYTHNTYAPIRIINMTHP